MNAILSEAKSSGFGGRILLFTLSTSGGVLWIMSGIILAMAPAGNPPHTFRTPVIDVRLQLALGLLMISISLGVSMINSCAPGNHRLTKACIVTITGGVVHLLGRLIRDFFLQKTGWEPLLPIGFLLCVGGLLAIGITSVKSKNVSTKAGILLIVTALFLLCFNDQYLPIMAVPFGFSVIGLSGFLGLYPENEER